MNNDFVPVWQLPLLRARSSVSPVSEGASREPCARSLPSP
jgi:hypothetical protein